MMHIVIARLLISRGDPGKCQYATGIPLEWKMSLRSVAASRCSLAMTSAMLNHQNSSRTYLAMIFKINHGISARYILHHGSWIVHHDSIDYREQSSTSLIRDPKSEIEECVLIS